MSILWLYQNENVIFLNQRTIVEAQKVYKSIPHSLPTYLPMAESMGESHLNFDTFDGHDVMVYNEPNL
jgi:hypothetical protein